MRDDASRTSLSKAETCRETRQRDLARDTFERLRFAFETGSIAAPGEIFLAWYRFAGRPVRLRVLGEELARCAHRPIAHLAIPEPVGGDLEAELTIDMWDEAATGLSCTGCVARDDLTIQSHFSASVDDRFVVERRAQLTSAMDRGTGHIVAWVGDARRLTRYELGRPLHSHLLLWHRDRGVDAIHSGLVAKDGQGVLFGGAGGSGKSTVALTCLAAGFDYLADDYVGLERQRPGSYLGYSLYASTAIDPSHLRQCFPHLLDHEIPGKLPHEDKSLVQLAELYPGRITPLAEIRAVALPKVSGTERTTVRPASTFEAIMRLAPSSLLGLPHANSGSDGLAALGDFLASVPTYWLELGRDLTEIPKRVDEILCEAIEI